MNKRIIPFPLVLISSLALFAGCSSNSDSPSNSSSSQSSISSTSSLVSSASESSSSSSESSSSSSAISVTPPKGAGLLEVIDLNGDGFVDVLWSPIESKKVYWYRNSSSNVPNYTREAIIGAGEAIESLTVLDLDDDQDLDVLLSLSDGSIVLYVNDNPTLNPSFTKQELVKAGTGAHVFARDLTGDGRIDLLVQSLEKNTLTLLTNSSNGPANFTPTEVEDYLEGAFAIEELELSFFAASVTDHSIYWYERDPLNPEYTQRTVSADSENVYALDTASVDGDDFIDLISASYTNNTIVWSESDDALQSSFTQTVISDEVKGIYWLEAADVDGDQDLDVLVASATENTISWLENDGAIPPDFTKHPLITIPENTYAIRVKNMDGDGDVDILLASKGSSDIVWYENDGNSQAPTFTKVE